MPKKKTPVKTVKKATSKKTLRQVQGKTAAEAVVKTPEVAAKAKKTATGVSVPTFNFDGSKTTEVHIDSKNIKSVSPSLLAQAIRIHTMNKRQGTVSTKTRGEVTGSTRKIYRQKGTGRARHGAITAPVFVGGGITFGPKPREFKIAFPQKMKTRVFASVFKDRLSDNKVSVVEGFGESKGKTKEVVAMLNKMELDGAKVLLLLDARMKKAYLGARNIDKVTIKSGSSVSVYDILEHDHLIVAAEVVETLVKRFPLKEIV